MLLCGLRSLDIHKRPVLEVIKGNREELVLTGVMELSEKACAAFTAVLDERKLEKKWVLLSNEHMLLVHAINRHTFVPHCDRWLDILRSLPNFSKDHDHVDQHKLIGYYVTVYDFADND